MELDAFLDRLEQVTGNGDGQYKSCCPAHDDQSPSMSVKATDDGTILVNCFAGCSTDEIVAALGLTKADLFAGKGCGGRGTTGSAAPGPGLTVEEYAANKMLPVEFLHGLGCGASTRRRSAKAGRAQSRGTTTASAPSSIAGCATATSTSGCERAPI